MSREEELLRGLIDGTSVDAEPQSRSEAYLKAIIDGEDVSKLGEPQSRVEKLYVELADVIEVVREARPPLPPITPPFYN